MTFSNVVLAAFVGAVLLPFVLLIVFYLAVAIFALGFSIITIIGESLFGWRRWPDE